MTELYDAHYYATGCGQPYERNAGWLHFFGGIADHIISDIGPTTVLDAGCALGFLVETLRERGVPAYGVDISEFAIASVHLSIKPFCWVGSLADPLPQRYDLVVTIEVLEHIPAADGERVIANLCAYTDDILFSSTPFDYKEATHCNVRPPEYWAERFARHGFYRDVEFDATFITPWAARFRKSREPVSRTIAAYERRWWQLQQENQARRELNIEQRNQLAAKEQELQIFRMQTGYVAPALAVQGTEQEQIQALNMQVRNWELRWSQLERSPGWRLLRALQTGRARLAPPGSRRDRWLERILRIS
jgi:SAM-dependent methyltransferase